jgi:L-asparaginase / beta-aspartyl-peptidase
VMDGATLKAGAIASVRGIKNPVVLARLVMEKSPHVMLSGKGAETFAKTQGMMRVPDEYFFTDRRWKELLKAKEAEQHHDSTLKPPQSTPIPENSRGELRPTTPLPKHRNAMQDTPPDERKFGTVGAVALDKNGNLAAATSTGGMTNKKYGRIGDTPIIGGGTYANNATCAVSCTGHGEFFIRATVAHDISALMEYKNLSLKDASELVVMKKLTKLGGSGGVIAVDAKGNISMPFNSEGMYRGSISLDGTVSVEIFKK